MSTKLDFTPGLGPEHESDHSVGNNSIVRIMTAGENVVIGEVCYYKSDGKFWKTDANAESTSKGLIALAIENINAEATGEFLFIGTFRDDTYIFTGADELFLWTVAGDLSATKPSGNDDVVRKIANVITADIIFFNPSPDYIVVTV